MSINQHHTQGVQKKVVRALLALTAIFLVVAIPLVVNDSLRLETAQRLNLAPGKEAERLADGDDGATLVIIPLAEDVTDRERYRYAARFIAWPDDAGLRIADIENDRETIIPLVELDHIAATDDGSYVLFRGPDRSGTEQAVLLRSDDLTADVLPAADAIPEIEGDWETPTWAKTTGICDRFSPERKFVACFNRADAASYLAGDWQVDVQLFGDFRVVEPVYRGTGFLPVIGFANDDTWLYFQNETGIWRIEVPERMVELAGS